MNLIYLKHAWQLLKQNRLYSAVYIVGTGLAISVVMVIAIIYYVKIAPVYPEANRNRTLMVKNMQISYTETKGVNSSLLSYRFIKEYMYTLKTAGVVSATFETYEEYPLVELADRRTVLPVNTRYVDDRFWQVFDFRFVSGKPFTSADFESGLRVAVLSSSMANTLFGTAEAEGRHFNLDGNEYKVCGVVRDVSPATPDTFSQIWVPFTVRKDALRENKWGEGFLGMLRVRMLPLAPFTSQDVIDEVNGIVQKINSSQDKYVLTMNGQPDAYWKSTFRMFSNAAIDWGEIARTFGMMLLALLAVPAVNLAGMVSSRMEKRLPEMGIRKVFGASRRTLFNQILTENLVLTVLGGLAGLVFSYLLVYMGRNWILTVFDSWPKMVEEVSTFFTPGMLFNPAVFLIAFGLCLILNALSALVPAYYGLKKSVVHSLNPHQ